MYNQLLSAAHLISSALAYVNSPLIQTDFTDPCVLTDGATTYAFATNSGSVNIQIASSTDNGVTWTISSLDALPDVGSWATTGKTWSPDVIARGDGSFGRYYSAASPLENTQCVGAATSTSPMGPYIPEEQPIVCDTSKGDAIDPAGFQDADGTRYVVYKVDGNNLGGEGVYGNADEPNSTSLMLQKLQGDGIAPIRDAVQVLVRDSGDVPLVEALSLMLHDGVYFLFFSSNCHDIAHYDISYATALSVAGPYTKASASFKVTGDDGLTA